MEENRLQQYYDEMGRWKLLTEEEEHRLSARALKGDERAVNRLVEANLRLVAHVAREYQGRGLAPEDLISEGNMGLVKAASKYDASRGVRFAGYASVFVRREIERALQREESEKMPENRLGGQRRSLDAPLGAKPNVSLLSILVDDNSPLADGRAYSAAQERQVEWALRSLNERETQVVTAYFGLGEERQTMAEIAADMGLKRERVRQIRNRAVRRMRKAFRDAGNRDSAY
ncbi:MAG: sigma-70 family RNA polymerase sigma factor [Prevotella sp.]|jgi:RNA polymerase primary sigma factor